MSKFITDLVQSPTAKKLAREAGNAGKGACEKQLVYPFCLLLLNMTQGTGQRKLMASDLFIFEKEVGATVAKRSLYNLIKVQPGYKQLIPLLEKQFPADDGYELQTVYGAFFGVKPGIFVLTQDNFSPAAFRKILRDAPRQTNRELLKAATAKWRDFGKLMKAISGKKMDSQEAQTALAEFFKSLEGDAIKLDQKVAESIFSQLGTDLKDEKEQLDELDDALDETEDLPAEKPPPDARIGEALPADLTAAIDGLLDAATVKPLARIDSALVSLDNDLSALKASMLKKAQVWKKDDDPRGPLYSGMLAVIANKRIPPLVEAAATKPLADALKALSDAKTRSSGLQQLNAWLKSVPRNPRIAALRENPFDVDVGVTQLMAEVEALRALYQ